jgi:hypothetical protein
MPITLEQIVEETRQMPPDVVAELVDCILVARHGGMDNSVEESWKQETRRRLAEIESGQVQGIPAKKFPRPFAKRSGGETPVVASSVGAISL